MKLCIFATPRSGSSYYARILHQYLVIHENYHPTYLTEIINPRILFEGINGEIKITNYVRTNHFKNMKDREILAKKRIDLLEKYKSSKYLFKIITYQVSTLMFDYLNENYEFLLIERKDKFDQLLSFLIAKQTERWNIFKNDMVDFQPLIGDYIHFREFEWQLKLYKIYKPQINNIHSIAAYEDLGLNLLKTIGFNKPIIIKEQLLPKKMLLLEEKKKLFKNLEEVKTWFNQSKILNG